MRILLIVIHIILLLGSCTSRQGGSNNFFRYNQEVNITSLDPAFAKDQANIWAVIQLYSGLVELDDSLHIQPAIARHWKISTDGRRYTFYLRDDVYFHDNEVFKSGKGRRVTAHDFVYTFRRLIDKTTASPGAWIFNDKVETGGKGPFVALNDSVFEVTLTKSFPPFLGLLCMQYCSVVPHEAIERFGKDFRANPVGTGPFQFNYWEEGVKMVLVKNPVYYEKENGRALPYLDGVEITFIENKQTAFFEFVQGRQDFFNGLEGSYKDELLTKTGQLKPAYHDKFELQVSPYLNTEYLGFLVDPSLENNKNNPLVNKNLRIAINYAIDRKKMMLYLRNNVGFPGTGGFIPPGLPAFADREYYGYDQVKVNEYLTRAGYPGGRGLKPLTIYTNKNYVDLTIFIQNQLQQAGIPVVIEVNPGPFHRDMVSRSQLPFFRGSWIADYPDAENYMALFYSKNFSPAGPNYTRYSNAAADRLYEQALATTDEGIRNRLYRQMDSTVMADAPVVVLFYDQSLRLIQPGIKGLSQNPLNNLVLKRVSKQ